MFARSKRRPLRSEPNSPREDAGSLKEPSLLEAEITGLPDGRYADNHVIQHLDLQEPGAFGEPASQASVRFTWRWIATGMIRGCLKSRLRVQIIVV